MITCGSCARPVVRVGKRWTHLDKELNCSRSMRNLLALPTVEVKELDYLPDHKPTTQERKRMENCTTTPAESMADWIRGPKKRENKLSTLARNLLVESCVNLCRKLARDFARSLRSKGRQNVDVEELESIAFLASVEASRYYDEARSQFTTTVAEWVRIAFADWQAKEANANKANATEFPELIVDREIVVPEDLEIELDARQAMLLKMVTNPINRDIVLLTAFAGFAPARVAIRLGMEEKDVKLCMRNAAGEICAAVIMMNEIEENGLFSGKFNANDIVGALHEE